MPALLAPGTVNPLGAPFSAGSWLIERWVFAIQIGRYPNPDLSKSAICWLAVDEYSTSAALYTLLAMVSILALIGWSSGYR